MIARTRTEAFKYPMLTREREYQLITDYQKTGCDKSLYELLRAFERMIYAAVDKYKWLINKEDAYSQGIIFLIEALRTFDITRDLRVSTYAKACITRNMYSYINYNTTVTRKPSQQTDRILRHYDRLEQKYLMASPGASRSECEAHIAQKLGCTVKTVQTVRATNNVASLDAPITAGTANGPSELDEDFFSLVDPNTVDPLAFIHDRQAHDNLCSAITKLNPRERYLLRSRYLSHHDDVPTFGDSAEALAVMEHKDRPISRQRIQQIEATALDKLRKEMCVG